MRNRKIHLLNVKKDRLDLLYELYKNTSNIFLKDIGKITKLDRTTIGKYYQKRFGQDYIKTKDVKIRIKKKLSEEHKNKISIKLKGRNKPPRSDKHRKNLSLAFKGRSFKDRF